MRLCILLPAFESAVPPSKVHCNMHSFSHPRWFMQRFILLGQPSYFMGMIHALNPVYDEGLLIAYSDDLVSVQLHGCYYSFTLFLIINAIRFLVQISLNPVWNLLTLLLHCHWLATKVDDPPGGLRRRGHGHAVIQNPYWFNHQKCCLEPNQ